MPAAPAQAPRHRPLRRLAVPHPGQRRRRRGETSATVRDDRRDTPRRSRPPATTSRRSSIATSWSKGSGGFRSIIGSWSSSTTTWSSTGGHRRRPRHPGRNGEVPLPLRDDCAPRRPRGRRPGRHEPGGSRMNTHPDVERIVTDWLHDDVTTAGSDKVLAGALVRVASVRQERIPRPERFPVMNAYAKLALGLAAAAVGAVWPTTCCPETGWGWLVLPWPPPRRLCCRRPLRVPPRPRPEPTCGRSGRSGSRRTMSSFSASRSRSRCRHRTGGATEATPGTFRRAASRAPSIRVSFPDEFCLVLLRWSEYVGQH